MTHHEQVAVAGAMPALEVAPRATDDLEAFVAEHHGRLLRLARMVCHDVDEAGDVVQAAFVRAWADRASLRDRSRLRPWLDRIVVHEAIRANRRPRLLQGLDVRRRPADAEPPDDPSDPRSALLADWSALRVAFERLPVDQRAALALHLDAGYSIAETAEIMGAPAETVRSRIRLAKDRLRRELGGTR